jgi:hypothetical protein
MTRRAARFVAAVTSHGCATPDQALRALEIAHAVGLDMKLQLSRVRSRRARERVLCNANQALTAQIFALLGEREAAQVLP